MRRLVVASTALLVLIGGGVVVGYLLLFSAVADRAARAAPADTALYLNFYLQPSAGQQMKLFGLIGKLEGFGDPSTLEGKIDEIAQRLLGGAGIDYAGDLRPWLGKQIAIAASPGGEGSVPTLLLAAVKDRDVAEAAFPRLLASGDARFREGTYRGRTVMTSETTSYALLDDLLIVASTPERLRAALDADADLAPSLADSPTFAAAMRDLPSDHLASIYLDLPLTLGLKELRHVGGYQAAALAVTADADGVHLDGIARFDADSASEDARSAFALGTRASTLAEWIPSTAAAEAVLFGASQSFADLESSLGTEGAFARAADALNQLRAIAAFGLGVNVDRDLLPLFDGETALALRGIGEDLPLGQILLRPADGDAAQAALDRMESALADRGSRVSTSRVASTALTSIDVPQIGTVAYAISDGIIVLGLSPADVAASLEAHAAGATLASDERYRTAFELVGEHAGNEFWADVPTLTDALAGIFDPGDEVRDILHQIGELAISATANDDRLEIHGVLTVN